SVKFTIESRVFALSVARITPGDPATYGTRTTLALFGLVGALSSLPGGYAQKEIDVHERFSGPYPSHVGRYPSLGRARGGNSGWHLVGQPGLRVDCNQFGQECRASHANDPEASQRHAEPAAGQVGRD